MVFDRRFHISGGVHCEWVPIVIVSKKNDKLWVCVD